MSKEKELTEKVDVNEVIQSLIERIEALEGHNNRHKGGPMPRKYTQEEINELQLAINEDKKNAAPPTR